MALKWINSGINLVALKLYAELQPAITKSATGEEKGISTTRSLGCWLVTEASVLLYIYVCVCVQNRRVELNESRS